MNQEKIGNFIKEIRKKNNLTQRELAQKLGVTYQAVSKWETGLNIPDISIIRQISKMYDIDIDEILDGEKKKKRKNISIIVIIVLIIILGISIFVIVKNKHSDNIELKSLSTSCNDFKIIGSAAYNTKKASLYISDIDYCGEQNNEVYDNISCTLYEEKNGNSVIVNSCENKNSVSLDDYLNDISIKVDNYSSTCKVITDANFYLIINAKLDGVNKEYKIPINLDNNCK